MEIKIIINVTSNLFALSINKNLYENFSGVLGLDLSLLDVSIKIFKATPIMARRNHANKNAKLVVPNKSDAT